ncbi:MAG: ABC transporter ATP-binding protein [Planctomycetota bacterium]|nr:ABC transporter ATP-binding protein [Planctomycetota bacterium]MDA1137383.1 ABC transporter ATP-binding protein [Planctomycetota bacterium]
MPSTIRIEGLYHSWGSFAFNGIDLDVIAGEYFVLLGPIGSGKTLLLESIAGLHTPDAGRILIGGKDITYAPPGRRGIGFVYQQSMLFPHMNVERNIGFGLRFSRLREAEKKKRISDTVDLLGLSHLLERSTENLSGGERQKVALARALAVHPQVLLLDEPLSPLDNLSREGLRDQLRIVHLELGMTTIEVTHDQLSARLQADRVGVIRDGQIIQTGTMEEVFERPQSAFVAEFLGTENVYAGKVITVGAETKFVLESGLEFAVETKVSGEAGACIRPELVRVHQAAKGEENEAVLCLSDISDLGPMIRLTGRSNQIEVKALITKPEFKRLARNVGDKVTFEMPSEAVHLFSA